MFDWKKLGQAIDYSKKPDDNIVAYCKNDVRNTYEMHRALRGADVITISVSLRDVRSLEDIVRYLKNVNWPEKNEVTICIMERGGGRLMFDWNKLKAFLNATIIYGSPSMQAAAKDILKELPEAVTVYAQCGEDIEVAALYDNDPSYVAHVERVLAHDIVTELGKNGAVKFTKREDRPNRRILYKAEIQVLVPKEVAETLKEVNNV